MATPPDFSVGQVLTAAHMDAVGLWLVKTQTVGTTVSSVTVTGAFSADFDNYRIIWSGGTMSAATDMSIQLSGLTSNYYGSAWYDAYTGGSSGINRLNNQAKWLYVGGGDSTAAMVNLDLFGPFKSAPTFMVYKSYSGSVFSIHGAGKQTNTTSVTDFILAPNSGTMTGGTVRVYGYRN